MMKDIDMEKELGKVFDAMPLEQLSETLNNIQLESLSSDSEQRIKDMVKEKLKKENVNVKSKKKSKRGLVAAAALVFVFAGTAIFKADEVKAHLSRLFGFVPGVGVVEVEHEESTVVRSEQNVDADTKKDAVSSTEQEAPVIKADKWYLLENVDATASDDMIQIELKDAVITGEELEIRYVVNLLQITDADIDAAFAGVASGDENAMASMYAAKGYDKYFSLDGAAALQLAPYSSMTINSKAVELLERSAQGVESTDGARIICVSETYRVAEALTAEVPTGVLSIAGVNLDVKMKNLELGGSLEDVMTSSFVDEMQGVKVMCVPTWKDDKVYVDFYTVDAGDYESVTGFQLFEADQCVLKVNEQTLENVGDYSYIFNNPKAAFIGKREYDVSAMGDNITSALVQTSGLVVKKALENKKIELALVGTESQALNTTMDIDGAHFEFVEASSRSFDSPDDYHYSEHGMLVLKYKMDATDENKMFMFFDEIRINGEKMEGYSTEWVDETYVNMLIPLSMPYSEVKTIEFDKALYQLNGTMEFDIINSK